MLFTPLSLQGRRIHIYVRKSPRSRKRGSQLPDPRASKSSWRSVWTPRETEESDFCENWHLRVSPCIFDATTVSIFPEIYQLAMSANLACDDFFSLDFLSTQFSHESVKLKNVIYSYGLSSGSRDFDGRQLFGKAEGTLVKNCNVFCGSRLRDIRALLKLHIAVKHPRCIFRACVKLKLNELLLSS